MKHTTSVSCRSDELDLSLLPSAGQYGRLSDCRSSESQSLCARTKRRTHGVSVIPSSSAMVGGGGSGEGTKGVEREGCAFPNEYISCRLSNCHRPAPMITVPLVGEMTIEAPPPRYRRKRPHICIVHFFLPTMNVG